MNEAEASLKKAFEGPKTAKPLVFIGLLGVALFLLLRKK